MGFHLASLLGFRRVPYSVSRNFKLPRAAWRFRGVDSSAQSVLCSLCSKNGDNICSETSDGFLLSGTVIATLPSSLNGNEGGGTFHVPNPWALSTMTTAWQLQSNFCLVVERDLLLGRDPLHLDLMDLAATDYLMGYAIRRELEVLNSSHYPLLLLPYTFIYHPIHATSNENLLETLAPLFQV